MLLIDKQISKLGDKLITPFRNHKLGNIAYDLTAESFCSERNEDVPNAVLQPGESVFVKSLETITLPDDIVAIVQLRNSRIREGLELAAPVYQPGHKTKVFYRITNISKNEIKLKKNDGIASISFIKLNEAVNSPYSGTFQGEFEYKGMGKYTLDYRKNMFDIEKKLNNIQEIEKHIYSNVLSLMGIFVAIFSLINVNVSLVTNQATMQTLITLNFATVGAIGFLIAFVNTIVPNGKHIVPVWVASCLAFLASVIIQFLAI